MIGSAVGVVGGTEWVTGFAVAVVGFQTAVDVGTAGNVPVAPTLRI